MKNMLYKDWLEKEMNFAESQLQILAEEFAEEMNANMDICYRYDISKAREFVERENTKKW